MQQINQQRSNKQTDAHGCGLQQGGHITLRCLDGEVSKAPQGFERGAMGSKNPPAY